MPGFGSASCVESVTIEIKDGSRRDTIVLRRNFVVEVNGQNITDFPLNVKGDYALISRPSSTKLSVAFKDGLRIFYDGIYGVDIELISLYTGKIDGLCKMNGSHKRNKRSTEDDDMKLQIEKLLRESCIGESCNTIDEALNIPHPCESNPEIKPRAEEACTKLKNDFFSTCHSHVDPESYYKDCLYDVCAFRGNIDKSMCTIFTAYANECSRLGHVIEHWRQSIQECGKHFLFIFIFEFWFYFRHAFYSNKTKF